MYVLMFVLIRIADNLESFNESDVYDNDNNTKTAEFA